MWPDPVAAAFAGLPAWRLAAGAGGMAAGVAALTAAMVPAMARLILPPPRETRLADHIPLAGLLPDGETLLCRDGSLVRCFMLDGRDIMFLSAAEREALFHTRKRWLDALAEAGVAVRSFLLRAPAGLLRDAEFDHPLLTAMAAAWNRPFAAAYRNSLTIVLSVPGRSRSAASRLAEAAEATMAILHGYGPRPMTAAGPAPLLAFWGAVASPVSAPAPRGSGAIGDMICADTVEFTREEGLISFRRGPMVIHGAAIGIRRYGDHLDEQMMVELGSLDGTMVIFQAADPWSKTKAALTMAQQGRMSAVTRFSRAAAEQYEAAMDMIEGLDETRAAMATHALTLFVFAETTAAIDGLDGEIRKICAAYGATAVREGAAAQASWFAQFPSYGVWPRTHWLFSPNIAALMTFDRPPAGLSSCDWGEGPLATFRTAAGTAYAFQLHVTAEKDAVAHAVCIGPTGCGKTTFICFLAAMALRHPRLCTYIFDRYQGAYVFATALGGAYLNPATGEGGPGACSLNPFQCADTPANRAFLRLWLRAVSGCDDPESAEEIGLAVRSLFENGLPVEQRSLSLLFEPCFAPGGVLRRQLGKWVDPSLYGPLFNGARDRLDMGASRLIAFDMTDIFRDELLAQATLSYLMHRIQANIAERNAPALIFIDETEPMLKNPMFRSYYLTMLQEYRKRGAAVVSAFQRPEAIAQAGMSEAIRGQCQTTFFFPNPQARAEDYVDWSLTDSEWAYLKGDLPLSRRLRRSVLVKRASGESVVLDIDLAALGPYVRLFASGRESVGLAIELQNKHGRDWVKHYVAFNQ